MITRDSVLEQVEALRQTLLAMDEVYRSQGNRIASPEVALGLKAMRELQLSLEISGLKECFKEMEIGHQSTDE